MADQKNPPIKAEPQLKKRTYYKKANRIIEKYPGDNIKNYKKFVENGSTTGYWHDVVENLKEKEIKKVKDKLGALDVTDPRTFKNLLKNKEFGTIFTGVAFLKKKLSDRQIDMLWRELTVMTASTFKIYTIEALQPHFVPINDANKDMFFKVLEGGFEEGYDLTTNSDRPPDKFDVTGGFSTIESVEVFSNTKPENFKKNKNGGFFKFANTTVFDLERYQVYKPNQISIRDNCLIHSLKLTDLSEEKINSVILGMVCKLTVKEAGKSTYQQINRVSQFTVKSNLNKIVNVINRNIIVRQFNANTDMIQKQIYKAKKSDGKDIELALYMNHFFIYEDTIYSSFSVNNYNRIMEIKEKQDVTFKRYLCDMYTIKNIIKIKKDDTFCKAAKGRRVNSLRLMKTLMDNNFFIPVNKHQYTETVEEFQKTDFIDLTEHIYELSEQRICLLKDKLLEKMKKGPKHEHIYFADTENYVNTCIHRLMMLGVVNMTDDTVTIFNEKNFRNYSEKYSGQQTIILKWLSLMTGNGKHSALCYYHNLKYDLNIIEKYVQIRKKTEKSGAVYAVELTFKGKLITLVDSYKMINKPLVKFNKTFALDEKYNKKEAMAYGYFTPENNGEICKVDKYKDILPFKERPILMDTLKEDVDLMFDYNMENNTFNPTALYEDYLRLDCLVLKKGIIKLNSLIKEITTTKNIENGLSIFESLTISSLSDKFMILEGCYDDVYEVAGTLREFISKAVYGGRVDVNKKYQGITIKGLIDDFDAVSSYPSAMARLCDEMGLPKGAAKLMNTKDKWKEFFTSYDKIKDEKMLDTYVWQENITNTNKLWSDVNLAIVEVKITAINKKQQMPFIAHRIKGGSTEYLNKIPKKNLIIDSIALQDLIEFHEIEFDIIKGVYWNEGGNNFLGGVIKNLFQERLKVKDINEPLGEIIKLMLNSVYGKTIISKSSTVKKIVKAKVYKKIDGKFVCTNEDNLSTYIYSNHNTIKSYRKINETQFEVEEIDVDYSYNRGHVGCAILSMAKRMMNEVFNIANDNGLVIYYTDTDSMHVNHIEIKLLAEKYEEKYGRVLIGKQLGQFHSDFSMAGAPKGSVIVAIKSIFLAKKVYHDKLRATLYGIDGADDVVMYGYHNRMKGVTEEGLIKQVKDFKNNYTKLYQKLAEGKPMKFTLNPFDVEEHKQKVLFNVRNGQVTTKPEFNRTVKFTKVN